MDSECVPSLQNNKSVHSTFGDSSAIISKGAELIQTKRRHPTFYILPVEATDGNNAHKF